MPLIALGIARQVRGRSCRQPAVPAAVSQYAKGCTVDEVGDECPGDPAMLTVPPRSRWSTRQIALLPAYAVWDGQTAGYRRFLGIIAPQEAVGSITIDGVALPPGEFVAVGDGRHLHAQVERSAGVDLIESPVPISVYVYGIADGEAFDFELRGSIPDSHEDWGLCADAQSEDADEQRVTVNLVLRVTPGANDDEDELEFESRAVVLHCSFTE